MVGVVLVQHVRSRCPCSGVWPTQILHLLYHITQSKRPTFYTEFSGALKDIYTKQFLGVDRIESSKVGDFDEQFGKRRRVVGMIGGYRSLQTSTY